MTEALLRPAFELAVAVARAGEREEPPVPVPRALRPVLGFARLPPRALETVRRVLDDDAEFRDRVAGLAEEVELGRASMLFLTRPKGWEDELASLVEAAEEVEAASRDEHAERSARRRLEHAETAARRAEEALSVARAEATRARQELETATRGRRAAEAEARTLRRRVESLEGERDAARRRAEEAETGAERRRGEVERLREQVRRLEAEVERLGAELAASAAPVPASAPTPAVTPGQPTNPGQLLAVARALAEAARAGAELSAALWSAAEGLGIGPAEPEVPPPEDAAGERREASEEERPRAARRGPAAERVAVALPPGIFDDSAEAAEHLVRTAGLVLVVDGYNASLWAWPELPISEQRRRLVDALNELSARSGASVHVVFDGAEAAEPLPGERRSGVRVRFSPPEVEADDLILALVDEVPARQPVLVATDDRRVQSEARRRGANVIGVPQLFGVLRRER